MVLQGRPAALRLPGDHRARAVRGRVPPRHRVQVARGRLPVRLARQAVQQVVLLPPVVAVAEVERAQT